jgi:apolipoprotein N-acyltransferase
MNVIRIVKQSPVLTALFCGALSGCAWRGVEFLYTAGLFATLCLLRDQTPQKAGRIMWAWGLGLAASATPWLWSIFGPMSCVLWCYIAMEVSVFGFLHSYIEKSICPTWLRLLGYASAWASMEFMRAECLPLSFPWLTVAHAETTLIQLSGMMPVVGTYASGGLYVALLLSIRNRTLRHTFAIAVVMVSCLLTQPSILKAPQIPIALVQAEAAPLRWLTRATPETKGRVIVWPELSVTDRIEQGSDGLDSLRQFQEKHQGVHVFGTMRSTATSWQNTALTMQRGQLLGSHVKNHTVHLMNDGQRGDTQQPITTEHGKIGTPICFDCDHQDVVRKMTLAGAEFFAVPSLDPARWGVEQHEMHGKLFALRAMENNRALAVASGSGVTQIINERGQVSKRLPLMKYEALEGFVTPNTHLTFFTQWGWFTNWLCLLISSAFLGLRLLKNSRTSNNRTDPATLFRITT